MTIWTKCSKISTSVHILDERGKLAMINSIKSPECVTCKNYRLVISHDYVSDVCIATLTGDTKPPFLCDCYVEQIDSFLVRLTLRMVTELPSSDGLQIPGIETILSIPLTTTNERKQ